MEGSREEPRIGAVVIARNEAQTVGACLSAARQALDYLGGGEILLVDSASTDRTAEIGLAAGCRVLTLRKASKFCPAAARRIGASLTHSRAILFLDGDCELEPGFLPAALAAMEADPAVGVVAGQRMDYYRTREGVVAVEGEYYRRQHDGSPERQRYGGCALYRRAALEAAGSFDPFLGAKEEEELAYRIRRAGFRLEVLPLPMIRHVTVPRESPGRLLRSLNHGFYLGRGQAARVLLLRGEPRAAFRELDRTVLVLAHLLAGAVCLALALGGTRWPAALWLGATLAGLCAFLLRTRSLRRVVYYCVEWIVQGVFLLLGLLRPHPEASSFRWEGEELSGSGGPAERLPRVLLVGPRPDPPYRGGVEKGVDLLLRSDLARRTSMRAFNNYRPRDPHRPFVERMRYQLGKVRDLRRELAQHPADLVHVKTSSGTNFHQNALYVLVARLSGFPVILQIHSGRFAGFYGSSSVPLRAWIRQTLASSTRVAVLSSSWAERISVLAPRARLCVVPNGLESSEIAALEQGEDFRSSQVLFVGTGHGDLDREKGLDDLLAILPELARRHPEARWVLAGLAAPEATLRRLSEEAGGEADLRLRVSCLGIVAGEAKAELLRGSSILVFPSYFENMPNLVLEGMAAGLGMVATDVGAVPEMLGYGEGGLLISPGDPAALKSALDRLLASPSLVRSQGKRNRAAVVRDYTMEAVQEKLEDLYREAAGWPQRIRPATSAAPSEKPLSSRTVPFTNRPWVRP